MLYDDVNIVSIVGKRSKCSNGVNMVSILGKCGKYGSAGACYDIHGTVSNCGMTLRQGW